ncbi:hypothetical protein [Microbacterium sp. NPDC058389]|uniref:hypothetical protein n=1 Tax=Microbacterium sp. NPDC058389 TaxID=3346475 RepID=UPI0036558FEA
MNDELTPREHDDMRDLLIAGTQRIRPAAPRRARIAGIVAVVLVAATVGGVTATALSGHRLEAPAGPSPSPTTTHGPSQAPVLAEPTPMSATGEDVEGVGGQWTRLPAVFPPAPGTHFALAPDPVLTARRFILGTSVALDEQGIDVGSAHGFQSVDTLHPWIADLKDGDGMCILLRTDYVTGGWSDIVCDQAGVPAVVERELDGALLRFTIVGGAIDVFSVPR